MDTILIFTGGERPDRDVIGDLPAADLIVAADSGYDLAVSLGFVVDVLVGDLDSVSDSPIPDHVIIERHPIDKEQTDLDLAIELALREEPARLVIVGGAGDRHDHELATTLLLCSQRWSRIDEIDWFSSRSRVHLVRDRRIIHGDIGSIVSLIPTGGDAVGVTTRGLKWELSGETLFAGSTRGVSNVMTSPVVDVRVEQGCLLFVVPHQ